MATIPVRGGEGAGRVMKFAKFLRKLSKHFRVYFADERSWFDERFYWETYEDVRQSGSDPFHHFMLHGWREGRNPSPLFNTLYYRDKYIPGVSVNPLTHYVKKRRWLRRVETRPATSDEFLQLQKELVYSYFDQAFYAMQWPERPKPDLLTHYLSVGWKTGKSPSATFDVNRYYSDHKYAKALDVSPLYQFASQMRLQHQVDMTLKTAPSVIKKIARSDVIRDLQGDFEYSFYYSNNPDVARAGIDGLSHYVDNGWREGRNPSAVFDTAFYLAENPDVRGAPINPFHHYVTRGRSEGRRPNPFGSRPYPSMTAPKPGDWAQAKPAADVGLAGMIVVMPVFKGLNETLAAIFAVLTAPQRVPFALCVINDQSPDREITATLRQLARDHRLFDYIENETNLGFVKTVNSALRRFPDKSIILLNADALVFDDWLDRIAAHVEADRTIATLTPMSNNATICSYPVNNANNLIELEVPARELDRYAAVANRRRHSEIPTGVGFCFYMSVESRRDIGLLDEEAFARGLGEENDFCLRASRAGYLNVLAEDVFVYHAGRVSFSEFIDQEYARNQRALVRKHPQYPLVIKQYLETDAGLAGRLRLDLYRLAQATTGKCVVFVYHALAGGILTHVQWMEARLREEGVEVIHVRLGVDGRWNIDISSDPAAASRYPNLRPVAFLKIREHFSDFLRWLRPSGIHVHSTVGFEWTSTTELMTLIMRSGISYYFTLHDYSAFCHRNDLVKPDGHYCGMAGVSVCKACVAMDRSHPEAADPVVRRQAFRAFLVGATAVFAPSEDIKNRVSDREPQLQIHVRPHDEPMTPIRVTRATGREASFDIVVLGAIGMHKGSRVLLSLARDAKARGLPLRFHVVGYSDLTEELLHEGVSESGRYETERQMTDAIQAISPSCILLPSIWPETYCFALSMAFRLGIPPIVFGLGAQRDRVLELGFGHVVPTQLMFDIPALNDLLLLACREPSPPVAGVTGRRYESVFSSYYDPSTWPSARRDEVTLG